MLAAGAVDAAGPDARKRMALGRKARAPAVAAGRCQARCDADHHRALLRLRRGLRPGAGKTRRSLNAPIVAAL